MLGNVRRTLIFELGKFAKQALNKIVGSYYREVNDIIRYLFLKVMMPSFLLFVGMSVSLSFTVSAGNASRLSMVEISGYLEISSDCLRDKNQYCVKLVKLKYVFCLIDPAVSHSFFPASFTLIISSCSSSTSECFSVTIFRWIFFHLILLSDSHSTFMLRKNTLIVSYFLVVVPLLIRDTAVSPQNSFYTKRYLEDL